MIVSIIAGCIGGALALKFFYMFFQLGSTPLTSPERQMQFDAVSDAFPMWFVALGFIAIAKLCFQQYKKYDAGIKGEEKLQSTLDTLPAGYHVLSNVNIKYNEKRSEIDNLVISTNGIVIVEAKNYSGMIQGEEDEAQWKQVKISNAGHSYENAIRNPLKQVDRQIYILKMILNELGIRCWIDGYVYMANSNCQTDSDRVFTYKKDLLNAIDESGRSNSLTQRDINKILQLTKG